MMSDTPKKLLDKCLEIEGLLALLMQRKDSDIPEELFQLIEKKAETLYMEVGELRTSFQLQPIIEETPKINIEPTINSDEINESESTCDIEANIEIADIEVDYSDLNDSNVVEIDVKPEYIENYKPHNDTNVEFKIKDSADEVILSLESENNDHEIVKEEDESSPTKVETKSVDTINKNISTVSFQIKLSLNDIYRFRRELFNFSDEEMEEALDALSEMTSKEEIEDYFYNDLCWEPEDEVVCEFMSMIKTVTNP